MDKIDIEISIYFSNESNVISLKEIVEFTDKWADFLKKEIDKISYNLYTLIDDKGKIVVKDLKYTRKNMEAVYQIPNDRKLLSFQMYRLAEDYYLQSRDVDISMIYGKFCRDWHRLKFSFDRDIFKSTDKSFNAILNDLIILLKKLGSNVKYGIIVPMEREKFPGLYLSGIASDELTEEERNKAFLWGNYNSQCSEKVWDVFWGTILTKNHLSSSKIINEIKDIVGDECVKVVCEGLYLITYPINILDYEASRRSFDKYHSQLSSLLEKYNLLISE